MQSLDNNILILVCGASGSGKTTFANTFSKYFNKKFSDLPYAVRYSADDYFLDESNHYKFDRRFLPEAHEYCKNKVESVMQLYEALEDSEYKSQVVIVDNTNLHHAHRLPYYELAAKYKWDVLEFMFDSASPNILVERNVHNVPLRTIERQISLIDKNNRMVPIKVGTDLTEDTLETLFISAYDKKDLSYV